MSDSAIATPAPAVPQHPVPAPTSSVGRPARPRPGGPRLSLNVAPGVHRLEDAFVNVYLIEDGGELTIVDSGLPKTFRQLRRALEAIDRGPGDVKALVLTHAHVDHLGSARRIQEEWGVPVHAHHLEAHIARRPYRYARSASPLRYPLQYPRIVPVLWRMFNAGAASVVGLQGFEDLTSDAGALAVPGSPRVVFTPGHTLGHCALHLPDRDAILTGDALVTFNPYTGTTGAQVVSAAAAADLTEAFRSLDALGATDAGTVLPGHGDPMRTGIRAAVMAARRAGPS